MQILNAEAGFKSKENFLKKSDSVGDARVEGSCYLMRNAKTVGILMSEIAVEMYPIYGPRGCVVRTISMREIGGKDEKLTG